MLLKVLKGVSACQNGNFTYTPGEWTPPVMPVLYQSGYHVTDEAHLLKILFNCDSVWEAETRGETVCGEEKSAHESIRLVRQVMGRREIWHLRADIAEGKDGWVLAAFERQYPGDSRVRDCIATMRRYANGAATVEELRAARQDAYSAYYDAAAIADAAATAADAAADVAADAADATAIADAADDEERSWQQERVSYWLSR